MLVTVVGAVRQPMVTEVAMATPVSHVLAEAGGPSGRLNAILFGGYFGSFLKADEALGRPYSRAGLAPLAAGPGAGVVLAIDDGTCGLSEVARIVGYLASQSAGQCGPCVFGLAAMAAELEALARGRLSGGTARLQRWAQQVQGRGGCHLPDGATRLVLSALRAFSHDVSAHLNGHCLAGSRLEPRSGSSAAA
jgi:NADH:ubiquinone oxidoreductase subunit F (NADH-binding)